MNDSVIQSLLFWVFSCCSKPVTALSTARARACPIGPPQVIVYSLHNTTINPPLQCQLHLAFPCLSKAQSSSSSCMLVMNHNWSARNQRFHLQSAAAISRHSILSRKDSTMCDITRVSPQGHSLQIAISFCRHHSVPATCKNGSVVTTVAEGGQNPIARLWGHTLGENWPPELTSSYASIDFWCQLVASPATAAFWMSVVVMVGYRYQAG